MAEPDGARAGNGSPVVATLRYFAAARSETGVNSEQVRLPAGATVADALAAAVLAHGPGLARVLSRCSYLLEGIAVHTDAAPITDGDAIDVLPPFAGG